MKKFFGILFVVGGATLSAQDEYPNILERDSFPGVKSLEISGYILQFGEDMDTLLVPYTQSGYTFSESGAWITRGGVFPEGDVSFDSIWYDAQTRTKYIRIVNDFEPHLIAFTYDAKGKVISQLYTSEQRDQQLIEYEYDKSGRVKCKSLSFADQKTVEEYTYDKKGKLISRKQSTGSIIGNTSMLDAASIFTYNKSGRVECAITSFYGASGVIRSRDTIKYEYDALGHLVLQRESRGNGATTLTTWKYDEQGRTTLRTYKYSDREGNNDEVITLAEYDSLGYCRTFTDSGNGYGFSLSWSTVYNEKGFPVSCYYATDSEIILYKWEYVYR